MIDFNNYITKETLTKEFILTYITEEQIFCRFFPLNNIKFDKLYKNPLRSDDDEGCSFFYSNKVPQRLYFNDFAWRIFDCFTFVSELYKKDYHHTLLIIAKEFKLLESDINYQSIQIQQQTKEKQEKIIKVLRKNYTKQDLDFWHKYDKTITKEDLQKANIYSLDIAWINDKKIYQYKNSEKDVAFFYHLQKGFHYQLYNPNGFYNTKHLKFFSSSNDYIIGWETIDWNCEYLLIGKAKKEHFLMKRFGINCICIMTENKILFDEVIFTLKDFLLFTLFDNDYAGKIATAKYKKLFGTIPLLFPKEEEKDFSDNLEIYGKNYIIDYITEIKQNFNLK